MAKDLSTKTFDYSLVTKEEKGKLINLAGQIKRSNDAHAAAILQTGELLATAQEIMAADRVGTFCDWVEKECKLTKQTAYNYLNAWKKFGNCPTVGQFEPSAMYALAASEEAKQVAMKMADKGQTITQKIAQGLVKEAKEREPAAKSKPPKSKPAGQPKNVVDTDEPAALAGSPPDAEPEGEPCPNCGGTKWTEDTSGLACAACSHPHGEPLGDLDPGQPEWKTIQAKARKTFEAGLRVIDDLHQAKKKRMEHANTISTIKIILKTIREW